MNKLKAFVYVYKNSLLSIGYYKDVLKTTLAFSLKYFFSLAVISSILITISVSFNIYPELNRTMEEMLTKIKDVFPSELVISTKGNEWSINLPEPLIIPFPEVESLEDMAQAPETPAAEIPENLIVFDHNGTVEDFENLNTLILVNEKNVLVKQANKYDVYPIEELPDTQFDRSKFDSTVESVRSFTKYLPYILAVFIFLGTLFYYLVLRTIYILMAAFITWMGSFIFGSKLTYTQNMQVCLHAMTLPITIEVLINAVGFNMNLPFWFALVNIGFAMVVIMNLAKDEKAEDRKEPKNLEDINPPSNTA
ncbi:DUF1189 domain-containing protein [candidate division WWE3 bacterium]|jgi:hypothetical protein|uniref:DUF1189 domain-containing protein n=1 Tax=candidate division WWE3 bacterium TaxID=2053526 RepID=A0A3A4ZD14_UNCKA|nr:MAG: DUF1189 domain-containing protein [candidate division WWE3 bacterium]